ncbi:MAG: hypothetical protein FWC98_03340, partial [Bacteroidales bacterium]|nr:hypothetical protein [Bacteroidales bacterium]
MRFCKPVIFFILLLSSIGKVEAQNAFNWAPNLRDCAGSLFTTDTISWTSTVNPLTLDGWYTVGGELVSGNTIISLRVGQDFMVNDSTSMLIFRSSSGATPFRDTLRITAVARPEIQINRTEVLICFEYEFTLAVNSHANADTVIWTDTRTGEHFSDGTTLRITAPRTFSALA